MIGKNSTNKPNCLIPPFPFPTPPNASLLPLPSHVGQWSAFCASLFPSLAFPSMLNREPRA